MRIYKLLKGDIRFQFRYGFYFVYFIFSLLYIVILKNIPDGAVYPLAILLIFSDPSAIGIIFSGAIVQLERSERTFQSLIVAPISPIEYVLSKLVSMALISLLVGLTIGLVIGVINHILYFVLGIIIGSMIFSCLGLIIAFKTTTVNHFFLSIIPLLAIILIPGGVYQFTNVSPWFIIHPGVAVIEMLCARDNSFYALQVLLVWLTVSFILASKVATNKFKIRKDVSNERCY